MMFRRGCCSYSRSRAGRRRPRRDLLTARHTPPLHPRRAPSKAWDLRRSRDLDGARSIWTMVNRVCYVLANRQFKLPSQTSCWRIGREKLVRRRKWLGPSQFTDRALAARPRWRLPRRTHGAQDFPAAILHRKQSVGGGHRVAKAPRARDSSNVRRHSRSDTVSERRCSTQPPKGGAARAPYLRSERFTSATRTPTS
jgi:hypothetical protein